MYEPTYVHVRTEGTVPLAPGGGKVLYVRRTRASLGRASIRRTARAAYRERGTALFCPLWHPGAADGDDNQGTVRVHRLAQGAMAMVGAPVVQETSSASYAVHTKQCSMGTYSSPPRQRPSSPPASPRNTRLAALGGSARPG